MPANGRDGYRHADPDVVDHLHEGVVRRDDGEIVVCRDVGSLNGGDTPREGDRFLPIKTWLDGGCWLVGGANP